MRRSAITLPALGLVVALACAGAAQAGTARAAGLPLFSAGTAGAAFGPGAFRVTLPAGATGSYVPGTSLLAGFTSISGPGSGPLFPTGRYPTPLATTVVDLDALTDATREWLAAGAIPGRTPAESEVATRALLDLALLTDPNGASVASPFGPWQLVWPRDASWHAAAFAATGHPEQARTVLDFLARTQDPDGTWAARYRPDGAPVADSRPRQLDAVGWVPWAVWLWWRGAPALVEGDVITPDIAALRSLWPMVAGAADAAANSLGPDGLPRPSADYWEQRESRPTLGTATPLLLGLRSAGALAAELGEDDAAERWGTAARRLDDAITDSFGATGYRRYPVAGAGPDSAVTFRSAPLAAPRDDGDTANGAGTGGAGDDAATDAVRRAEAELLMPSGGLRPGNIPRVGGVAWTPATALFALAAAGRGDEADFQRWFGWLAAHRTTLGAFPEKVTNDGLPASVAPLGWTCSIVLLALVARDGALPSPPGLSERRLPAMSTDQVSETPPDESVTLREAQRGFVDLIGAEIVEASAERAVLTLDCRPEHQQPHGVVHGGVHCTLVETAASVGGYMWLMQRGTTGTVVGVSNNTDFIRPFTTGRLTATATPIHCGRTQQLWLVEITDENAKLIARGEVRLHNLEPRA